MKAKARLLTLAVCIVGAAAVTFAADPQLGTWRLNTAKSKMSPGAPINNTVVIQAAGDSIKVIVDGTSDGKPAHNEWTGKFDGKDYPVTGDPNTDTRAYNKVDDRTFTVTNKKAGKVTSSGRIVVSADGKSRTVATSLTNPQGKKIATSAVYDKQ